VPYLPATGANKSLAQ